MFECGCLWLSVVVYVCGGLCMLEHACVIVYCCACLRVCLRMFAYVCDVWFLCVVIYGCVCSCMVACGRVCLRAFVRVCVCL